MNKERERERETVPVPVLGPSVFGLGIPVAVIGEKQVPIGESRQPGPKKDSLGTRIIDAVKGTNRARPVVLTILDNAHASGEPEITDKEIQRRYESGPRPLLAPESVNVILDRLKEDGQVRGRRITAEQALESGLSYGNNYSRITPEPETIFEASSEQPQGLDL